MKETQFCLTGELFFVKKWAFCGEKEFLLLLSEQFRLSFYDILCRLCGNCLPPPLTTLCVLFLYLWVILLLNYIEYFSNLGWMWEFLSFILIIHPVKTIQQVQRFLLYQMSFLASMNQRWVAKQRGECVEKLSQPVVFLAARPAWPSQLKREAVKH